MNIIAYIKERAKYYNCPVCGNNLRTCEVAVLRQAPSQVTVQVTCKHCAVAFDVVVVQPKAQLPPPRHPDGSMPGVETPITADELIELHQGLSAHTGSLTDLLGRRPSG